VCFGVFQVFVCLGVFQVFIKIRKRVGESIEACGTPLLIGRKGDVAPSTMTEIEQSDRKLEK